jgi:hypothetical protein
MCYKRFTDATTPIFIFLPTQKCHVRPLGSLRDLNWILCSEESNLTPYDLQLNWLTPLCLEDPSCSFDLDTLSSILGPLKRVGLS